jgi:endoglucanase
MGAELSHGLNRLSVSGNMLVDSETGEQVTLRGLVRSGLEYSSPDGIGSLLKAGITAEEIQEMVVGWGAKIIRLPFNQEWALRSKAYDPEPYLAALDFIIDRAAAWGAYTLLDLQWLDARTPRGTNSVGTINFVPPLPGVDSIALWRQLAARYAEEPAVLFDLFNEPHDAHPDDPVPLLGIREDGLTFPLDSRRVSMAEWQPWALHLIRAIRCESASAVIFVSGVNWGYDLRGFPLPGVNGIVYSTHVYCNKGTDWDRAFGKLASEQPVFVGEWGGGPDDFAWGRRLADYVDARGIGWAAWSWSDVPRLVQAPPAPPYLPTEFGKLVRSRLRAN